MARFEKLKYINHIGESLNFGQNGLFVNANTLHDYTWAYSSDNGKISSFSKEITPFTVPVVVACPTEDEGIRTINRLMECAEKDVLANEAGTIIIGEYYLKCFIVESKKSKYNGLRGFVKAELKVVSDYPMWIKEYTQTFTKGKSEAGGKNFDLPHDFPYDYSSFSSINTLKNPSFVSTDFKITIHGPVENPLIYIAGWPYKLNCNISRYEYVTIDSKAKTIVKTKRDGSKENYFRYRDKENYIFEKIPAGELSVTWVGDFVFEVILYEERSEPKWT